MSSVDAMRADGCISTTDTEETNNVRMLKGCQHFDLVQDKRLVTRAVRNLCNTARMRSDSSWTGDMARDNTAP